MPVVDINTEAFASLSTWDRLQVLWQKGLIRDFEAVPLDTRPGERAYVVWMKVVDDAPV